MRALLSDVYGLRIKGTKKGRNIINECLINKLKVAITSYVMLLYIQLLLSDHFNVSFASFQERVSNHLVTFTFFFF